MTDFIEELEKVKQKHNEELEDTKNEYNTQIRELKEKRRELQDKRDEEVSEIKETREKELKQLSHDKLGDGDFVQLLETAKEKYLDKQDLLDKIEKEIEAICHKILDEAGKKRVTVSKEITIKGDWVHRYKARRRSKRKLTTILDEHTLNLKRAADRHELYDEKAKIDELSKLTYNQVTSSSKSVSQRLEDDDGKVQVSVTEPYNSDEEYVQLYNSSSWSSSGNITTRDYHEPENITIIARHIHIVEDTLQDFIEKQEEENDEIRSTLNRVDNIVQVRTAQSL